MEERFLLLLLLFLAWPTMVIALGVRRLMHKPGAGKRHRQVWTASVFLATPVGVVILYFFGHTADIVSSLFASVLGVQNVSLWGLVESVLLLWLESIALFPLVVIVLEVLQIRKAGVQVVAQASRRDVIIANRSQVAAEELLLGAPDEVDGIAVFGRRVELEE